MSNAIICWDGDPNVAFDFFEYAKLNLGNHFMSLRDDEIHVNDNVDGNMEEFKNRLMELIYSYLSINTAKFANHVLPEVEFTLAAGPSFPYDLMK